MTFFESIMWLIHWVGMVPLSEFKHDAIVRFMSDKKMTVHGEYVYSNKLFDSLGIDVRTLSPAQKHVLEVVLGEGSQPADLIQPPILEWLITNGFVVCYNGIVYDARLW